MERSGLSDQCTEGVEFVEGGLNGLGGRFGDGEALGTLEAFELLHAGLLVSDGHAEIVASGLWGGSLVAVGGSEGHGFDEWVSSGVAVVVAGKRGAEARGCVCCVGWKE